MAYNNTIRQDIFKRLGVYIKWWYELAAMKSTLDAVLGDASTNGTAIKEFKLGATPSAEDKAAYEEFSIEIRRQKEELESLRRSVVSLTSGFLGRNAKSLMSSPYSNPDAVLDHLLDAMDDYGDQVLENTVSADATVTEDPDNSVLAAGGLSLDFNVEATQAALPDSFALTCVDDSIIDGERWMLESARLGQYSGNIVTNTAVDWTAAGITGLTIPKAPKREASDASNKVSDWKLSGAVRGVTTTSGGRFYLKFGSAPTLTRTNDELAQLTSFSFSAAVFGAESDIDGKLYVSLTKEPAAPDVLGGVKARISEADLVIDGATSSNTDNGTLYAKVIKSTSAGTSTYTLELYKDASRSTKVASGSGTAPEDEAPTDPIALTQSGGSGMSGKATLSAFASVEDSTDQSILIKVPLYYVRVYRSSTRAAEEKVAQGISYAPTGSVSLTSATGFTTAGSVTLNYIEDNDAIELSGVFYTIDAYRADPSSGDTTEADIVARAGKLSNLLTGSASDLPFYEVNGSGLHDTSVDLAAVTVSGGYIASAYAGFAKGDKFTFAVSASDDGRFQTFLRDNFGKVFPAVASSNEVDEAWAGA